MECSLFEELSEIGTDRLLRRQKILGWMERETENLAVCPKKEISARRRECMGQRRLCVEMERDTMIQDKRNSKWTTLCNLIHKRQRYIMQTNGLVKLRWKAAEYFKTKSALYQEIHARDCLEIVGLRRICCEERKRARLLRTDELYMPKRKQDSSTVNQLMSQIGTLQDKMTASSSGMSHVPSQSSRVPSPRDMPSRILDCRITYGTRCILQETFLKVQLLKREHLRRYLVIPRRIWQIRFCEGVPGIAMRRGEGLSRESQSSTMATPRFFRNVDTWNSVYHTGASNSQNCMMEPPRKTFSDLPFGKFPDLDDFQCWRVIFKTEVYVSTSTPRLTMSWICRRSYDVAVNETRVFSWFWGAWCEDCVCVEKDHFEFLL